MWHHGNDDPDEEEDIHKRRSAAAKIKAWKQAGTYLGVLKPLMDAKGWPHVDEILESVQNQVLSVADAMAAITNYVEQMAGNFFTSEDREGFVADVTKAFVAYSEARDDRAYCTGCLQRALSAINLRTKESIQRVEKYSVAMLRVLS